MEFAYICAAADKISTDIDRRAVPLQSLSRLLKAANDREAKQLARRPSNCHR